MTDTLSITDLLSMQAQSHHYPVFDMVTAASEREGKPAPYQAQGPHSLALGYTLPQGDVSLVNHPQTQSSFRQSNHSRATPSCLCSQRALETLRGLDDQYMGTDYNGILLANGKAVSSLLQILSCSHADDTSLNVILVAIGNRRMDHYQLISSCTTPPPAATTTTGSRLTTPGANEPSDIQPERSRMEVVLDELRTADGLMSEFQARFCTGPISHKKDGYCDFITVWRTMLRNFHINMVNRFARGL